MTLSPELGPSSLSIYQLLTSQLFFLGHTFIAFPVPPNLVFLTYFGYFFASPSLSHFSQPNPLPCAYHKAPRVALSEPVALCLLSTDLWEVPFEEILDLQWVGSGAQGAVFLGRFHGEEVAVKKVRDLKETDIKHLRKLKHPNIITFK